MNCQIPEDLIFRKQKFASFWGKKIYPFNQVSIALISPGVASLSGATVESVFNNKIDKSDPSTCHWACWCLRAKGQVKLIHFEPFPGCKCAQQKRRGGSEVFKHIQIINISYFLTDFRHIFTLGLFWCHPVRRNLLRI